MNAGAANGSLAKMSLRRAALYMMSPGGHRWRTAIIFANNFELKKSNYEMTDIYGVIMDAVKGE